MAYDQIIEQLKTLKKVRPDENFKENTRHILLAAEPTSTQPTITSYIPSWGWVGAVAVIMLVVGSAFLLTPNTQLSSFDTNELQQELNNLNIEIDQISYTQETNEAIASALNEISNTRANHLNRSILEKEQNNLNDVQNRNGSDIDQMLNKIIF